MGFINKIFKGELGWKTVTGGLVVIVVTILQILGIVSPELAGVIYKLAGGLGLIGIRDAIAKAQDALGSVK